VVFWASAIGVDGTRRFEPSDPPFGGALAALARTTLQTLRQLPAKPFPSADEAGLKPKLYYRFWIQQRGAVMSELMNIPFRQYR
jgi:hypothetical protein